MRDIKKAIILTAVASIGLSFMIWGFIVLFSPRTTTIIPTKTPSISEEEKYFDQLTEDIIQCESQGKMVWGDLELAYPAFGIAQFQRRTFNWLSNLANKDLDYNSEQDQRWLLRWALENNYGRMWTCYEIVKFK